LVSANARQRSDGAALAVKPFIRVLASASEKPARVAIPITASRRRIEAS
jgi:hypothetical protein